MSDVAVKYYLSKKNTQLFEDCDATVLKKFLPEDAVVTMIILFERQDLI